MSSMQFTQRPTTPPSRSVPSSARSVPPATRHVPITSPSSPSSSPSLHGPFVRRSPVPYTGSSQIRPADWVGHDYDRARRVVNRPPTAEHNPHDSPLNSGYSDRSAARSTYSGESSVGVLMAQRSASQTRHSPTVVQRMPLYPNAYAVDPSLLYNTSHNASQQQTANRRSVSSDFSFESQQSTQNLPPRNTGVATAQAQYGTPLDSLLPYYGTHHRRRSPPYFYSSAVDPLVEQLQATIQLMRNELSEVRVAFSDVQKDLGGVKSELESTKRKCRTLEMLHEERSASGPGPAASQINIHSESANAREIDSAYKTIRTDSALAGNTMDQTAAFDEAIGDTISSGQGPKEDILAKNNYCVFYGYGNSPSNITDFSPRSKNVYWARLNFSQIHLSLTLLRVPPHPRVPSTQPLLRRIKDFVKTINERINSYHDDRLRWLSKYLGHAMIEGCVSVVGLWYEAGNIRDFVKRNPGAEKLFLTKHVASALDFLHTMEPPIIHSGVCVDNVLIDHNGDAVLCNTSLAQFCEEGSGGLPYGIPSDVRRLAPEFFLDGKYTKDTDIYAFGCLMLTVLTGHEPFADLNDVDILLNLQKGKGYTVPETIKGSVKAWRVGRPLISGCMSYVPTDRPSMGDIVKGHEVA